MLATRKKDTSCETFDTGSDKDGIEDCENNFAVDVILRSMMLIIVMQTFENAWT